MASIIVDLSDDIKKLQSLKAEIQKVKKELGSINVNVHLDIKRDMEAKLKSLTSQYDALVQKVSEAEGKVIASTQRINQAAEKIIKAQEQLAKATGTQPQAGNVSGVSAAANQAQTASVQVQAKAYDELAQEIDEVIGTRAQNIRRIVEEQNAIKMLNAQISNVRKNHTNSNGIVDEKGVRLLEHYNSELEQHKIQLAQARQQLSNNIKLDVSAATSMNALSQSLGRMRMAYRELTEEERKSPFGQELLASIQQADAKIKQLDATIGNHQRNVGNYASGWNGLGMSIQQIGRELPSLAMGINTFFLAISNNLPILTDEIARARKEYNALKAAGQQATPVWKQVVSSLVSWQTALTVGITLLTLYGKDIIEWVGNLFKAKDGTAELEAATKRLNTTVSKVYGSISEEMRNLRSLNDALQNAKRGTDEWESIRQKIVAGYSKYLPSIDSEIEKTGTLAGSYDRLAESIQRAAAARGFEKYSAEEDEKYFEERNKQLQKVYDAFIDQLGEDEGLKMYQKWLRLLDSGEGLSRKQQGEFGQIGVGWGLGNANSALFELRKAQEAHDKALERYREIFNMSEGAETALPPDSIKAMRESIAARREALEQMSVGSKEYAKLKAQIEADERNLEKLTQKQDKTNKEADKRKESRQKLSDELLSLQEKNQQAEIDLMKEGAEKKLKQIEADYEAQRNAIAKQERDWAKENKEAGVADVNANGLTTDQQAEIDHANKLNEDSRLKSILEVRKAESDALNDYLKEYGTFQQKRLAITEEYQRKIAEAETWGDRMTLQKQMEESLKELEFSRFKSGISFADIFGNLDAQTTSALKSLRDKLEEYINNAAKGLRPEDLKELQDAFKDLDLKIAERDPFGEFGKALDEYRTAQGEVSKAQQDLNAVMQGGEVITGVYTDETGKLVVQTLSQAQAEERLNAAQKKRYETLADLKTTINSIGSQGMQLVNAGNEIVEMLENFGVEVPEAVSSTLSGIGQVMSELESIDITKPFSLITGAVSVFAGIGNTIAGWFGGGDKKNEKQIQRLQDQIDTLDSSYEKLGRSIEEAYSKDASNLIEQQNKALEQKKVLIQQQIKEEEDKKKTDNDRIKEWKEQIEEINQTIEDNKEAAVDAIFGEDLQSAIENFADAYAEAWTNGEDKAKSAKDTVKKMMQQMVSTSIKAAIQSSGAMEEIRNKLEQFYADNVLSGWEQDYIYNIAEELQKELDSKFGWADSLFENDDTKEQQSASSKGFETMTQDQASELSGRFTAVAESNYRIEGSITQLSGPISAIEANTTGLYNIADETRSILASSYLELQQISENTGAIIAPIQKIQKDIEIVKNNTSKL